MLRLLLIKLIFCLSSLYALDCQKRLFDIHIKESLSIEEALDELASYCTFSIIVKDEFAKNELSKMQKSLYISQMTLEELFRLLLKENNLNYEFDGKILSIWGISTQIFKLSYITSIREGQSIIKASVDSKPRQNDISLDNESDENMIKSMEKFDFWQNIEKEITTLLNAYGEVKTPIINANAGIIIVTGTTLQLKKVGEYINKLENRLKKQVIIDVSIIAVNLNENHSSGINWQNFNIDFASTTQNGQNSFIQLQNGQGFVKNLGLRANLNFNSVLNFLSQNGKTQVLSNPKLMALNNQQAIISVGDTINYQVKESSKGTENGTTVSESFSNYSIFVGILLSILPEISDDNKIMLRINPSLSDFKYPQDNQRQNSPRTIAPDTIQKKLSTVVSMENNQTLILGGLISHNQIKEASGVNFLSKIPLLGLLFSGEETNSNSTEIVFIITPSIVDKQTGNMSLKDMGFKHYE
ncbi:pilus (MSHA type) biogenesis protein MshL [Campylobacter vulpis]|uniref:General secretion pathway protein GspD n=1 Tax=Campylobacter vulpis TaxID=1655500 RepID=A0A2G4QZR2_9BACT|nr:pilus (MSHA type) biogenesis protein MshL [Campylobacter vulpis]MBS4236177.1 pilus (MSHA type) biogenesis protein MshL [Campylobacter vulpis]MBS4269763.1 pilus (MSHA type) biogenesis protein MshL [Campylobacter vulpis]MBS4275986.1 pilus (MSHA type) biogenesis protein MshL [Campylobacter vulpis]MBS4306570.1 pilus (MSHA type) biogenesis protein MshL [Campylobacter vulpis]MBS4313527.1 pilus (MSHA type) biogenesis protein MshL [Campylobacter vulpis]